jgi:hypothetical protein
MADQISTLDSNYSTGDLSTFPTTLDSWISLYEARNAAITSLRQSVTFNSKFMIVQDTSLFPDTGILHIGKNPGDPGLGELVWYGAKTATSFSKLIRGFAKTKQTYWPQGSPITSGVAAEHHNAIKDAIMQIERDLGLSQFPNEFSLNGILQAQENRFLAPKPLFRGFPIRGAPPLKVRFQNFTVGNPVRFLWDFGDGTTSVERSPIHTYLAEGVYTVKLNIITGTGAQGVVTKKNYVTVNKDQKTPFFYVLPLQGDSIETNPGSPTTFSFVDQTDGEVSERYWIFGDGNNLNVTDPNVHTADYSYAKPGTYSPSLMVIFADQTLKRVFLSQKITVF